MINRYVILSPMKPGRYIYQHIGLLMLQTKWYNFAEFLLLLEVLVHPNAALFSHCLCCNVWDVQWHLWWWSWSWLGRSTEGLAGCLRLLDLYVIANLSILSNKPTIQRGCINETMHTGVPYQAKEPWVFGGNRSRVDFTETQSWTGIDNWVTFNGNDNGMQKVTMSL